jgi:hypothetical protein
MDPELALRLIQSIAWPLVVIVSILALLKFGLRALRPRGGDALGSSTIDKTPVTDTAGGPDHANAPTQPGGPAPDYSRFERWLRRIAAPITKPVIKIGKYLGIARALGYLSWRDSRTKIFFELLFFVAGFLTFVVVLFDYRDKGEQFKISQQAEMTRNGPGGQSFISKHCLLAARILLRDTDFSGFGVDPKQLQIITAEYHDKLGAIHERRQEIDLLRSFKPYPLQDSELDAVRSCLPDRDTDVANTSYTQWQPHVYASSSGLDDNKRRLTTEGVAELMRRINIEANYDEQIATLTNHHIADDKLMTARFNPRICGTGQGDGDGLYFLELKKRILSKDSHDIFADYDGTVREVLTYISNNCGEELQIDESSPLDATKVDKMIDHFSRKAMSKSEPALKR